MKHEDINRIIGDQVDHERLTHRQRKRMAYMAGFLMLLGYVLLVWKFGAIIGVAIFAIHWSQNIQGKL
jgi:uncharacterized Tic20 family protein